MYSHITSAMMAANGRKARANNRINGNYTAITHCISSSLSIAIIECVPIRLATGLTLHWRWLRRLSLQLRRTQQQPILRLLNQLHPLVLQRIGP